METPDGLDERGPVPELASGLTYQEQFDRWFPDGAWVQVIQDVPEETDSVTYVCPRIVVLVEDDKHPELFLVTPGVKSVYFTLDSIEDYGSDAEHFDLLVTMVEGDPLPQRYRFSSFLTSQAREIARHQREGNPRKYKLNA